MILTKKGRKTYRFRTKAVGNIDLSKYRMKYKNLAARRLRLISVYSARNYGFFILLLILQKNAIVFHITLQLLHCLLLSLYPKFDNSKQEYWF